MIVLIDLIKDKQIQLLTMAEESGDISAGVEEHNSTKNANDEKKPTRTRLKAT